MSCEYRPLHPALVEALQKTCGLPVWDPDHESVQSLNGDLGWDGNNLLYCGPDAVSPSLTLHEIGHWVVSSERRRKLDNYGLEPFGSDDMSVAYEYATLVSDYVLGHYFKDQGVDLDPVAWMVDTAFDVYAEYPHNHYDCSEKDCKHRVYKDLTRQKGLTNKQKSYAWNVGLHPVCLPVDADEVVDRLEQALGLDLSKYRWLALPFQKDARVDGNPWETWP